MRHSLLVFFPLLMANSALGQTFFPIPAPLLEKEVTPEQANECFIFFENPGGDTLHLKWRRVEASYPAGWNIDLCDYGACYVGIPASGSMNPVYDTLHPYLKLIVQPGATPGAGWLWFRVWEENQPANRTDVYFSLHTPGVTASGETPGQAVRIFPNPSAGVLFLENRSENPGPARMTDINGVLKWAGILPARELIPLDLSGWPAGPYFLQLNGKTGRILLSN